jgi:D-alanine transaminase
MPALAYLNGEWMAPEEARVPIWDRAFLFGDGVYEALRVYRGRCWLEDAHFERLRRSLGAIRIEGVDLVAMRRAVHETLERSRLAEATVYIQITRGTAPRRHAFPRPPIEPTNLVVVQPYDDRPTATLRETGVAVLAQPDLRWGRCDIKSTNLLANVLANEEAHEAGAYEAILVDRDGRVTEATHSSLLWVRDGGVAGSPEGPEILPGTTRRFVRKLIDDAGLSIHEERIDLPTLQAAEEVILVGTTIEVLPVVRIDSAPVATGQVGQVARKLQQAFRLSIEAWLAAGSGSRP